MIEQDDAPLPIASLRPHGPLRRIGDTVLKAFIAQYTLIALVGLSVAATLH